MQKQYTYNNDAIQAYNDKTLAMLSICNVV